MNGEYKSEYNKKSELLSLAGILTASAVFNVIFLHTFPMVYGNDTVGRLLHNDRIFFAYWLPAFQSIIFLVSKITENLFVLRYILIVILTGAGAALYLFMKSITNHRAALYAVCLFLFSPMTVYLTLVPYQEVLFIAFVFLSLYYFYSEPSLKHILLTSLFTGLSCLTRYEGWILSSFLCIEYIRRQKDIAVIVKGALLFFWAAALIYFSGMYTSPESNSSLLTWDAITGTPAFLWFYLPRLIVWANPVVFIIALAGVFFFRREKRSLPQGLKTFLLFVLSVVCLLLFFTSDGTRFNTRFVFLPSVALCLIGGISTSNILHTLSIVRIKKILPLLLMIILIPFTVFMMYRVVQTVEVQTPYKIAMFLNQEGVQNENVLVVGTLTFDTGGENENDFARIVVQTQNGRRRIYSLGKITANVQLVAFIQENNIRYIVKLFEVKNNNMEMTEDWQSAGFDAIRMREIHSFPNVRIYRIDGLNPF